MPKLSQFKPRFMQRTLANRKRRAAGRRVRGRKGVYINKLPHAPLVVPIKCGYSYNVIGDGSASVDFRDTVGFNRMPADWFNRYEPIFDYVKINKVRIEICCPYNIGQSGIGNQSLYRLWYQTALTTGETCPDSVTEWLNSQRAKRMTFNSNTNAVNLYFTPKYETTVQPLNVAVTQLRTLSKQWQTIQTTPAAMTPHIGALAQVHRLDGGAISNAHVFKVNVTMYCELRGLKEL